jgi:hypothetical protein
LEDLLVKRLALADIGYDPKYYPRVNGKEDWIRVLHYQEILKADPNKDLDSIVVVKAIGMKVPWMLLDGLHRVRSYHRAGRPDIPAIEERLPRNRWLARSFELNKKHGRPLEYSDYAWTATSLREEGWKDARIAELLSVTVERLEKIIATRVVLIDTATAEAIPHGRSHRQIGEKHYGFLKAPFMEKERLPAEEIEALKLQAPVSSMSVLNVLDSALAVLMAGVDMTDEEIVERVDKLYRLSRNLRGQ